MTLINRKNVLLGLIAIIALSVPLTIGILQRQQDNRSRAGASTTLAFTPNTSTTSPLQKKKGDIISLDLMVTPGNNAVTFVKFQLNYDATKLQPVTPDPFMLNTNAFLTKDGPILSSGSILASASVGSDPTKAIVTPTKVGTVQFKAIGSTGSTPTIITFTNTTQALSSGANDQASENVLSTTTPANIIIAGDLAACVTKRFTAELTGGQMVPTNTGTSSAKVTIDLLATAGQANAVTELKGLEPSQVTGMFIHSPAAAGTIGNARVTLFGPQSGAFANPFTNSNFFIPADVITDIENGNAYININTSQFPNGEIRGKLSCGPAPSAAPTGATTPLSFELLLHGVGSAGDNPNPRGSDLSNKNPLHPQRNLHVEVFDTNNVLVTSVSGALSLNYDEQSGSFKGALDLGPTFREGNYNLKVKSDRYLRRRVPGIQMIKRGSENSVPKIDLVAGDVNSDNILNVIDYNAFLDCGYGEIEPLPIVDPNSVFNSQQCQAHKPPELVDVDDNGVINSPDYNLFLRELSVQNGD